MVSMQHEALVDIFKNRPTLAAEILEEVLGVAIPAYSEARVASTNLSETQPAEYRADLVIVLYWEGRPVRVIVVEVQLGRDHNKPFTWPAYLTISRDQHRCPAYLLVVAPDSAVADFCAQPIEIGVSGFVLRPHVLRREGIA